MYLLFFSCKEKTVENKTVHELGEINSFETALIDQHDLSHTELIQQPEILNELPSQHQPVIVRTPPTKISRLLLEEEDGKIIYIFNFFLVIKFVLFYTDKILDDVVITENDKINVQNLEHQFSQITNNYDVFLNQPTISLTRIDLSQHGIYFSYSRLDTDKLKYL